MAFPKVLTADEAAALIPDGATVTVSSSSGLGCPDAVLAAIGRRFDACGHPRSITTLHPIAAGDMWGIKGIDHIAKPGLLARVLAGSYPSGPSSAEPPAIWTMITGNEIPAYNIPSGILFDMHREAAAKRPGVLTKIGMDTFADPQREGCAMNGRAAAEPIVSRVDFDGEDWLYFKAIMPDVAIIRATTADERGNLSYEHEGGYLGPLDQALAVAQQWRPRHRPGEAPREKRHLEAARRASSRASSSTPSSSRPTRCRRRTRVYEPAISGEIFRPLASFEAPAFGRREGDRPPRRAGDALRRRGQYRLRHLGQRAAHPHRGGPPRRRHLGHRAGCRRRRAAARLPVRLRLERRGDRAVALPVHLLPGRRLRCLAPVLPADRPGGLRQRLQARRPPACDGRRRRLRRHHGARAAHRLLRLSSRPAAGLAIESGRAARSPTRARSGSSSRRSSTSPSPASARSRRARTSPTSPSAAS